MRRSRLPQLRSLLKALLHIAVLLPGVVPARRSMVLVSHARHKSAGSCRSGKQQRAFKMRRVHTFEHAASCPSDLYNCFSLCVSQKLNKQELALLLTELNELRPVSVSLPLLDTLGECAFGKIVPRPHCMLDCGAHTL
jgi:hypothetical protein